MPPDLPWTPLVDRLRQVVGANEEVEAAIALAVAAHATATRDEGTPYVEHPLRVALILAEELGIADPDSLMAALLHDVLEDSDQFGPDDIARACGGSVLDLVSTLTRRKEAGRPESRESRDMYLSRFGAVPDAVLILKMSDRLDNLRSLPRSPSAAKRQRYVQETRRYLLPLCEGRGDALGTLQQLIQRALDNVGASES
jgi:guanosine-3',5'-bis(diphosphate) 3'-pyrophosphohydrolase